MICPLSSLIWGLVSPIGGEGVLYRMKIKGSQTLILPWRQNDKMTLSHTTDRFLIEMRNKTPTHGSVDLDWFVPNRERKSILTLVGTERYIWARVIQWKMLQRLIKKKSKQNTEWIKISANQIYKSDLVVSLSSPNCGHIHCFVDESFIWSHMTHYWLTAKELTTCK